MKIFKFVFSPIEVNTYILVDESGDCAIIDCGCYDKQEFMKLEDFIKDKRINPVLLLNTHCHLDHIFGNRFVLEKYGLRTFSCELDEMNRKNAVSMLCFLVLQWNIRLNRLVLYLIIRLFPSARQSLLPFMFPAIHPEALRFYSEKNGCVFTGDALFAGSIGRTDLQGGDYNTLIESIKCKLFVLPPSTVVYPGHGNETTIEREMKTNPFFS